ncbi:hypothetical protein ACVWY2_009127 [Bradyrhizobium sp. JR6.1]
MRPLLVAGGDEQLRDILLVEVFSHGEVARRAERAEHQQHVLTLDEIAGLLDRGLRIGAVIDRDELDLAAIDAAMLVDHVEIGRFRPPDGRERGERSGVGHDIADTDLAARLRFGRLLCTQWRRREHRCEDKGYRKRSLSFCLHQHRHNAATRPALPPSERSLSPKPMPEK